MTAAAVAHGDKRLEGADVGVLRGRLAARGVDEIRVVGRAKDVTDQVAELVATLGESVVKDVLGRFGHLAALAVELPASPARFAIGIDGEDWFEGEASSVMVSNLPDSVAGMRAFPDADPTDGRLDVGVVLARTRREWLASSMIQPIG